MGTTDGKDLTVMGEIVDKDISPRSARAINALRNAKVPKEHIKSHPGKGGKTFKYVPHTVATQTMNDALGMAWDWEVLDVQMLADGSGIARGKMTLHWQTQEWRDDDGVLHAPEWHTRVITEVGAKEAVKDKEGGDAMSYSFILASAASRSLLRCMLRAFGYGMELYVNEDVVTPEMAWAQLLGAAKSKKVKEADLVKALKEAGITKETLVDRFEEAYALIYKLATDRLSKMPDLKK